MVEDVAYVLEHGISRWTVPHPDRGPLALIKPVELVDALGRVVRTALPTDTHGQVTLSTDGLPARTYIVRLPEAGRHLVRPVTVVQ